MKTSNPERVFRKESYLEFKPDLIRTYQEIWNYQCKLLNAVVIMKYEPLSAWYGLFCTGKALQNNTIIQSGTFITIYNTLIKNPLHDSRYHSGTQPHIRRAHVHSHLAGYPQRRRTGSFFTPFDNRTTVNCCERHTAVAYYAKQRCKVFTAAPLQFFTTHSNTF